MGCDIHLIVEVQNKEGQWKFIEPPQRLSWINADEGTARYSKEWYGGRCYTMFAVLADVRNFDRTGRSYEPIKKPIHPHRGYPKDLSPEGKKFFHFDGDEPDMDYHSATWYTVKELMEFDWDQPCGVERGGVGATTYKAFKETGKPPDGYFGGSSGEQVSNEEMDRRLSAGVATLDTKGDTPWTVIEWPQTYRDAVGYFLKIVEELDHPRWNDRIRFVMAFDN